MSLMSRHPFLNILAIIVLVSGIFFLARHGEPRTNLAAPAGLAKVAASPLPELKPGANQELVLAARAFLSAFVAEDGTTEILVEQNEHRQVPIASVSKLMTALVSENNFNREAVVKMGDKNFTVDTALDALLVESNNGAAAALAKLGGESDFVRQMNESAQKLGMEDTYYSNPSGLDEPGGSNFSSPHDLLILAKEILFSHPKILEITRKISVPIFDTAGELDHVALSTDVLLTSNHWPAEIVGGKTGETLMAKKNLVLILKDKQSGGHLVNVILGTDDNFAEMTKLLDWIYATYRFS